MKKKKLVQSQSGMWTAMFGIIVFTALFLAPWQAALAEDVSGYIETNTTWNLAGSPYIVTSSVTVRNNATLTIEPGVQVKFWPHMYLTIGYGINDMGKLVANGTEQDKILFTANESGKSWSNINFSIGASNESSLTHAVIEKGGSNNQMILVCGCDPVIQNCTIRDSASNGLKLTYNAQPVLASNTYQDNNGYPINVNHVHSISAVDDSSDFTPTDNKRIRYIGGNITVDTSVVDPGIPYFVDANVTVYSDATLTIAPGVELQFDSKACLRIGTSSMGKLVANGDEEDKILFTASDSENPWSNIDFSNLASDESSLTHAMIENGGSSTEMIWVYGCDPVIQNCTIKNSKSNGLRLDYNAQPYLAENTYQDNNGYPINVNHVDSISAVDATSDFTGGNTDNRIRYIGGDITVDTSIVDPGIPYFVYATRVDVYNNAVLTIAPGVELQFNSGTRLGIGISSIGKLVANGDEEDEIRFTASDSEKPWSNIFFGNSASENSSLTHAVIENGGLNTEMILVYGCNPVIQNCTIKNSASDGLRLDYNAQPDLASNIYQDNNGYPINVDHVHSISAVDDSSDFGDNPDIRIRYAGGNITVDTSIVNPGIPYFVDASVNVYNNAVLTIDPGVKLQFNSDTKFIIGSGSAGKLIAQGTDVENIIFTSSQANPAPGDWIGIYFLNNADNDSIIKNAVIEYGNSHDSPHGNIYVYNSSPTIERCEIRHSIKYGIYVIGSSAAPRLFCNKITENPVGVYVTSNADPFISYNKILCNTTCGIYVTGSTAEPDVFCNAITENPVGVYVTGNANPFIHDNNILGNTMYGVQNDNSSVVVFAKKNYWGAADGPSGEGPGSGDEVSTNVDYSSFLTASSPCTIPPIAAFSAEPTTGCQDLPVKFTDGSTGAITAWEWDFDGDYDTDSYDQNPVYTYTVPGTYSVTLTVYEDGESDTETQNIEVTESLPIADFEGGPLLSGIPPLTVNFTDLSASCGTDSITDWKWDFDNDGIIDSYQQNPSCTFSDAGQYTVKLTVTDEDGDNSTEEKVEYITVSGCEILGDLDGDCDVDGDDRNILRASLRKCEGDSGYNADADYDGDGCISFADYRIWYSYYKAANLP